MRLHLDSSSSAMPDVQLSSLTSGGTSSSAGARDASGVRDSIAISTTSSALGQIASERVARLQQISQSIASGTYQVSSAAISGAILAQAAR